MNTYNINCLMGMTLTEATQHGDESISFTTTEGRKFQLYHQQDCCESVYIEDVAGDLQDLVGEPIVLAEEVSNAGEVMALLLPDKKAEDESFTWTYYRIGTRKGTVSVRFYGSSNGYYSESASFTEM